jgi:hypothetical protein
MNWHTWLTGDTKWTYQEQCHQMQAPWSDNAIMVFQHHLAHEVAAMGCTLLAIPCMPHIVCYTLHAACSSMTSRAPS